MSGVDTDDDDDDDDDGDNSEDVPAVQTRTADAACTDPEEAEIRSEAGHPQGQSRGDCPACTSCTSAPVDGKQNYHKISCQLHSVTILMLASHGGEGRKGGEAFSTLISNRID